MTKKKRQILTLIEREQLRELYLDDLRREVSYGKKVKPRARRVDSVWAKIEPTFYGEPIDVNNYENVWVWSDIHFGHANIINYCDRPYKSAEEMTVALIENHNNTVKPGDLVIWVGDVSFVNETLTNEILDILYGDRILVVGNHDMDRKGRIKKMDFNEQHLLYLIDDEVAPLIFTHYPMGNVPKPWINVHGHIHNNKSDEAYDQQQINVSVEVIDYKPIHLNTLKRMARTRLESMR